MCLTRALLVVTDFIKNADMMWKQSVWTSSIAAALAAKYLKEGGILTLPGAAPCVKGTAGIYYFLCLLQNCF